MIDLLSPSWPGLSRPSTSLIRLVIEDVDATATRTCPSCALLGGASRINPTCADKRGHDESNITTVWYCSATALVFAEQLPHVAEQLGWRCRDARDGVQHLLAADRAHVDFQPCRLVEILPIPVNLKKGGLQRAGAILRHSRWRREGSRQRVGNFRELDQGTGGVAVRELARRGHVRE